MTRAEVGEAALERRLAAAMLAAVLAAGCGDSDDAVSLTGDEEQLADAMCSDLRGDFSLAQMATQSVSYYRDTGRDGDTARLAAAELMDAAITEKCPEFTEDWRKTILYEDWIAPQ